jgi:hypothetical protein
MHTPTSSGFRLLVVCTLVSAFAALCTLAAVVAGLPGLTVVLALVAGLGIVLPVCALVIGWPILLILGVKAAFDLVARLRGSPRHTDR